LLTSTLDGIEWSASRPGRFTPAERASVTRRAGGWVDPRAGLGAVAMRETTGIRFPSLPGIESR